MRCLSHLLACAALVSTAATPALLASPPAGDGDGSSTMTLLLYGGPTASDVEILLNGETVARVDRDTPPPTLDVDAVMREGANELTLRLTTAQETPGEVQRLRVSVAPMERTDGRPRMGKALVDLSVPEDLAVEQPCEEVRRFWVGPPARRDARLKKRFWLHIHGPSVQHAVTVLVNGAPVADVTSGNEVLEITGFLSKGKNTVEFEGRASCVGEVSAGEDYLQFDIGTAESRMEAMSMGDPLARFDLHRDRPLERFTKKIVLRAW